MLQVPSDDIFKLKQNRAKMQRWLVNQSSIHVQRCSIQAKHSLAAWVTNLLLKVHPKLSGNVVSPHFLFLLLYEIRASTFCRRKEQCIVQTINASDTRSCIWVSKIWTLHQSFHKSIPKICGKKSVKNSSFRYFRCSTVRLESLRFFGSAPGTSRIRKWHVFQWVRRRYPCWKLRKWRP